MKRLSVVGTVLWSMMVLGLCSDAEAARCPRPNRRCCVGVTHQPCATAAVRVAPKSENLISSGNDCACAFYKMGGSNGLYYYYGVDFPPDCSSGTPVMITGNFDTSNPNPCPTCPTSQCMSIPHQAALSPGSRRYVKPGTRLEQKLQWDQKLALNSGQQKMTRGGIARAYELEAKELADAKMLVSFTNGNTLFFAKLHVCRIEAQELGGNKAASTVTDFAFGQEIDTPPADQKVRDVTSQVTVLDSNVAEIKIGNTTYQIVTATSLAQ